jgi:hypothetical protein
MAVDDQYTKSLLHFDGANASTTFLDESGKTWTRYGDAQISTAQKKFGPSSALFNGNGDYITTPSHADFDFGAGNFTIDFWVRSIRSSTNQCWLCKASNGDVKAPFNVYQEAGSYSLKFYSAENSSTWGIAWGVVMGTLTQNVWAHVAFARSGTSLYLFVNGVIGNTVVIGTKTLMVNTDTVRLGSDGSLYPSAGSIDELRFSKGIARWTSDFSSNLPTFPYPGAPACYIQNPRGRNRCAIGGLNSGISSQNSFEGY